MHDEKLAIEELSAIDDGWWESILAEEEIRSNKKKFKSNIGLYRSGFDLNWENAIENFERDQIIIMDVININKGGLLVVHKNFHGFIPCSHLIDLSPNMNKEERDKSLSAYLGKKVRVKIIECLPCEGKLVFSERAAQTESGRRTELMKNLQVGQSICGVVTNITDFGVFVDLGGVEGLIHISELSWGRVDHPSKILVLGQKVNVLILEIQLDRCRVALSIKRLTPNPWIGIDGTYHENQIIPVEITSLASYGAFARVDDCIEGLIHYSEIPLLENRNIKDVIKPGDKIMVKVIKVDISRQRLGLSLNFEK
jgi:small subunit ribosomal protein S1